MQKLMTLQEISARIAELEAKLARKAATVAERNELTGLYGLYNMQLAKANRDVQKHHNYRARRA